MSTNTDAIPLIGKKSQCADVAGLHHYIGPDMSSEEDSVCNHATSLPRKSAGNRLILQIGHANYAASVRRGAVFFYQWRTPSQQHYKSVAEILLVLYIL